MTRLFKALQSQAERHEVLEALFMAGEVEAWQVDESLRRLDTIRLAVEGVIDGKEAA